MAASSDPNDACDLQYGPNARALRRQLIPYFYTGPA
jgi:hypothetical protein